MMASMSSGFWREGRMARHLSLAVGARDLREAKDWRVRIGGRRWRRVVR